MLYLPVLTCSGISSLIANDTLAARGFWLSARELVKAWLSTLELVVQGMPTTLVILLHGLALLGALFTLRSKKALILTFLSLLVIVSVTLSFGFTSKARFWLFLVPVYYSLVATGFTFIVSLIASKSKGLRWLAVLMATVVLIVSSRHDLGLYDVDQRRAEEVSFEIAKNYQAGDVALVFCNGIIPLAYYLEQRGLTRRIVAGIYQGTRADAVMQAMKAKRVFIITDLANPETLKVFDALGGDIVRNGARLLVQYPYDQLFLWDRSSYAYESRRASSE